MGELIPSRSGEHLVVAPPNLFSRARQIFSRNGKHNQNPWQVEVKSLEDKWKYLFENQLYTDVMLVSGPSEEVIECHRLLLILHSPVFESMLSSRWSRSSSSSSTSKASLTHEELYLPDDDPKIVKLLLENVYNVDKTLESISVDDTLALLLMAKKYICPHVISSCIAQLKLSTTETNVIQIYQSAVFAEEPELESFSENFILTKACNLARIGEFPKFTKSELIYFVKRDDLNIDEVELFNAVYKWGEEHCAAAREEDTTEDEDSSYSSEDLKKRIAERRRSSISEALENILPLIRFPCMSLEDFSVQVVSKSILPLPETVQVYKYLSTPPDLAAAAVRESRESSLCSEDSSLELKFCTQPRSRKIFTYIFKRLKGHGFDFSRKWQNMVFQVDQNIRLMSLGFFRAVKPSITLSIGVRIYNYEMDVLMYEFEDDNTACNPDDDIFHVKLPKPFEIKKNEDYTISYIIRGEETFYKSSEPISIQLACCTDKKITFWIKEAKSDTDMDQVPEICFQLYG